MDDVVDQENTENAADTYDQFIGAEVCTPDEKGRKFMARVTKRLKYNEVNLLFFVYHSLYEVSFPNSRT